MKLIGLYGSESGFSSSIAEDKIVDLSTLLFPIHPMAILQKVVL